MPPRFYEILYDCTVQVRVGDIVRKHDQGAIHVTTIDALPAEADLVEGLEIIDMVLLKVGVHLDCAEKHRAEFVELIESLRPQLQPGPSYISIGGLLGDQGAAFQMMALGQTLGLWKVITPKTLGITNDAEAANAAGIGYVMISGYPE